MNQKQANLENACHILGSSLTGHFPQSRKQALESIKRDGWTDEDIADFVNAYLPIRKPDRSHYGWDFDIVKADEE